MISFISTYPPIICGIGTYTKYITDHLPANRCRVFSFKLDGRFFPIDDLCAVYSDRVEYCLSYPICAFGEKVDADLLWFQHSYGIWEDMHGYFLDLMEAAKRTKKRVCASFHTIHFQSEETPSGMTKRELNTLSEVLPLVDFLTVFTDGAYQAVVKAFPAYSESVSVLRHGVHLYPRVIQSDARKKLFSYLKNQAKIPLYKKRELDKLESYLFSPDTILLGNYGFINAMKNLLDLYKLGSLVQEKISHCRVITLFAGTIPNEKEKSKEESFSALAQLKAIHNGRERLFFDVYLPESIFPLAFNALDFTVFWSKGQTSKGQTQSGRMAHAQGTQTCTVGCHYEGIGETLRMSGLPVADSLEELAEIIARLVLEPELKKEILARSRQYAFRYSFVKQAEMHLLLEKILTRG